MKNALQNLLIPFLFLTCTLFGNQLLANHHHNYFTIVIDQPHGSDVPQIIHYPQGTTFELLTKNGKTFASSRDDRKQHTYWGHFSLVVYPSYRKGQPDIVKIKEQRIRIFETAAEAKAAGFADEPMEIAAVTKPEKAPTNKQKSNHIYQSNGVTLQTKELSPSAINVDAYNVKLIFSNGVIFEYQEGKATATKLESPLEIKDHYLIESIDGTTKVSFNPKNGEVWWVFERTTL